VRASHGFQPDKLARNELSISLCALLLFPMLLSLQFFPSRADVRQVLCMVCIGFTGVIFCGRALQNTQDSHREDGMQRLKTQAQKGYDLHAAGAAWTDLQASDSSTDGQRQYRKLL